MILAFGFLLTLYAAGDAVNTDCPAHLPKDDNLRQFGSSCYEFVLGDPQSWHTADTYCKANSGVMVAINSYPEQNFVWNTMQILGFNGDHGIWIGLTDHDGEGTWHWADGTMAGFTNWADGQPGMVGGLEDCAMMEFKDGRWHDFPCEGWFLFPENHAWVCEYPLASGKK